MDFDNPGTNEARSELSDFSGSEASHETDKKSSKKEKGILGGSKKKDKEKKKEKEARYATLGDESSGEEEGKKKSKKKGFQFGSAKKEKKEKKELKDVKDKKEKKDKEKGKLKLKKLKEKVDADIDGKAKPEDAPVFGIALEQAVERSRCHDGIKLPVVVRECIDFIEEHALKVEGIYRSSGVKSKVNKLKTSYNIKKSVSLANSEPAVVASLLKLFLRELPDPVLTNTLMAKFEEVCAAKETGDTVSNLKRLLDMLPDCNRTLIEWIFVHMGHVIQYEKLNKMSLQNVSIVLSPTMKISHRVLYCLFKHSIPLFGHVNIKKYVPPISGQLGVNLLPESPLAIEEEMKKQESLLEDLHKEISKGKASKDTEEKLWEQQRIVTQLKRKLRLAKSHQLKDDPVHREQEEELNFSLQKPADAAAETAVSAPLASAAVASSNANVSLNATSSAESAGKSSVVSSSSKPSADKTLCSPDEKEDTSSQEHRVTVQIHQAEPGHTDPSKGCVTVIQLSQNVENPTDFKSDVKDDNSQITDKMKSNQIPTSVEDQASAAISQISISQNKMPSVENTDVCPKPVSSTITMALASQNLNVTKSNQPSLSLTTTQASTTSSSQSVTTVTMSASDEVDKSTAIEKSTAIDSAAKVVPKSSIGKKSGDYENVDVKHKKVVDFKPSTPEENFEIKSEEKAGRDEFPLLPPPPSSSKPSSRGLLKVSHPQEARMKSKSLPRGLPSSEMASAPLGPTSLSSTTTSSTVSSSTTLSSTTGGTAAFSNSQDNGVTLDRKPALEPTGTEELLWEEMKLKYQFEELLNLKSELERKKKMERREIAELHEEIATMQTLYQYRTYSVDSSEDSDVEEEHQQVAEDNRTFLRQLMLDQADLQQKKVFLLDKLETEREVCLNLRVQIRLEQEKLKRRGLLHMS